MCSKCVVARKVIRGDYGNGEERIRNLRAEGYENWEIEEIQAIVNRMLRAYPKGNIPSTKCFA